MTWEVRQGDCVELMRQLDAESIDAVVTDPPFGIGFMGKEWDGLAIWAAAKRDAETRKSLGPHSVSRDGRTSPRSSSAFGDAAHYAGPVRAGAEFQRWCKAWAVEALRVLKPGGHLLAFGGTRTYHRMVSGIEDAGFEIRDQLAWLFGSGFPKSLDVSKAIDKAAGAVRETQEVAGGGVPPGAGNYGGGANEGERYRGVHWVDAAATPEAERWNGWGTALKPAHEPIVMARKPLAGTVAQNVLEHGTGALNVDGCRIEHVTVNGGNLAENPHLRESIKNTGSAFGADGELAQNQTGRWPANVALDEEAARMLDEQTGGLMSGKLEPHHKRCSPRLGRNVYGADPGDGASAGGTFGGDRGGASRFLYVAKASRAERNAGLDAFPERVADPYAGHRGRRMPEGSDRFDGQPAAVGRNVHPTVKPIELMRWLVRMVTPPGGLVLDPFTGSGTTGCAAAVEGFRFLGLEREAEYAEIARARIAFWAEHGERALERMLAAERAKATRESITDGGQLDLLGDAA